MPRYRLTTPEQVNFHFETAGLATRAMAWTIDQLVLLLLRICLVLAVVQLGSQWGIVLLILGLFLLDFGYYAFFEITTGGKTPGKRYFRLRVVSAREGRLTFNELMLRNFARTLDGFPFSFVPLLGMIVAFVDPYRRRLGDFLAETLVIRDSDARLPEAVTATAGRVNTFQQDAAIRNRIISRVTREERDLIFELMTRRDELDPDIREQLFHDLARRLRERYQLPSDLAYLSDEQTVMNFALVLQSATQAVNGVKAQGQLLFGPPSPSLPQVRT